MPVNPLGPEVAGQLAAMNDASRRLFARGQVVAVNGNDADLRVGYDARGEALLLRQVPVCSGYAPAVGDWVAISYEGGHSGAPWVTGPSMAADATSDAGGVRVFPLTARAPAEPQTSTVYFDTALGTWRGWDGGAWREFGSSLHNSLGGLQGGAEGERFHFGQAEHDALQDFYDGSALASGYLQRLHLKAIDASGTQRTTLFEKDGDCYWTVNATYDAATGTWNRIDPSKYAYLVGVYSKNGIPHEPGDLGGIAWWRATPGTNPIGDYTAIGGWELGWMMTQHRNFVMGGMNLELDGSGSPPYGRLSQSGQEDPDNFTALLRNAWYEGNTGGAGEGSWGLDDATQPCWFAGFVDSDGFVLRYRAAAAGPFSTADWVKTLQVNGAGDVWVKRDLEVEGTLTVGTLSGFVRASEGVVSASALVDGDIPASIARDSEVAAYFNPTTGHDHDGTDAKKVEWANLNGKPSTFPPSAHTHVQAEISDLQSGDSVTFAALTVGASTVGALTVGNRNSTTYRAVFTEQGVNAEASAVFTTDAQKGRTLALFGNGAAYFMGRDVTNDIEFAMGTSALGLAFMGAMTNHGLELRTNNTARIAITGSGNIGFFGVTPVGRQTVAAFSSPSGGYQDGTARQRINDIIAALQNLGLFQ